MSDWRPRALLGILSLALVMRLAIFGVNHPFPPPADDDSVYDTLAWNMVSGNGFSMEQKPPYAPMGARTPGYPAFLASVYLIAGRTWDAVRVFQIALSLVTCGLVYLIGCRVVDRRHALLAAGMYAIWPAAAYYPALLLTESLQALLIALSVYAAYRCMERPAAAAWYFVVALSLAGATMVRPDYQLLVLLFFAALVVTAVNRRVVAMRVVLPMVCFVAALAPWAARNYAAFDRYIGLASGSGHTILVAELEAEGNTGQKLYDVLNDRYAAAFERAHGRPMRYLDGTLPGEDDIRRRDAIEFVKQDPVRYLEHSAERLYVLWQPRSWSDAFGYKQDFSEYRRDGRMDLLAIKAGFLLVDAVLLGLAGAGIVCALVAWRRFWPMLAVIAYVSVIYALVYSGGRYRVPVLPLTAVMASFGVAVIQRFVLAPRSWRAAVAGPLPETMASQPALGSAQSRV